MASLTQRITATCAYLFFVPALADGEVDIVLGRENSQIEFVAARSTVSLRLADISDSAAVADFVSQGDLVDTSSAITALGGGFFQVALEPEHDYAAILESLRANPQIGMVNPVVQSGNGRYMATRRATVRFRDEVPRALKDSLHRAVGSTFLYTDSRVTSRDYVDVRLDSRSSIFDILNEYYEFSECVYASPSLCGQPIVHSSDPLFSSQWHFDNSGESGGTPGSDIDATNAWKISRGDSNVTVVIIDPNGFMWLEHPDIRPSSRIAGWDEYDSADVINPPYYFDGPDYHPDCYGSSLTCWHGTAILEPLTE